MTPADESGDDGELVEQLSPEEMEAPCYPYHFCECLRDCSGYKVYLILADAEIEKGYADYQAGRTIPAKQVFAEIRKEYGV